MAAEAEAAERAVWWERAAALNPVEIIFVDESGTNVTAHPRYGWGLKGRRAQATVPRNYDENTTLVAALSPGGIQAALGFTGALNSEAFDVFLDQVLLPQLLPGQTVVMDDLSVNRRRSVRMPIEAIQAQLLYLPNYSLDFNPIELAFSQLNTFLRRTQDQTQDLG